MTDNEIVKALECCADDKNYKCNECPLYVDCEKASIAEIALDLINRQKAEIERLQKGGKKALEIVQEARAEIEILENQIDEKNEEIDRISYALADEVKLKAEIKVEAIKEFAERFENALTDLDEYYIGEEHENFISANKVIALLVNLVKEMVGDV